MVGTAVLIVKVIGVFPHIESQQGLQAVLHWIASDDALVLSIDYATKMAINRLRNR